MDLPKRKPNRLKNYDYSQCGAYFITACTKSRHEILWNVGATFGRPSESPQLSEYGIIIKNEIDHIDAIYNYIVTIDKYVIMPNHIHMIILLHEDGGRLTILQGEKINIIMLTCANQNAVHFYGKIGMKTSSALMMYDKIEWTPFTVEENDNSKQ